MLTMPSSSSAVTLNGVPAKDGGEHTYMVLRGGRHKEVLKRLLELCAINGLARIMITKNGVMLLRGPVDAACGAPSASIFPGMKHVVAPVEQGPREPQLLAGRRARRRTFPVRDREAGRPGGAEARHRRDEGARCWPEADRVAEEWGRNRVKEAVAKGANRKRAEAQVKRIVQRRQAREPPATARLGRARARGAGGGFRHHAERRHQGHGARDLRRPGRSTRRSTAPTRSRGRLRQRRRR